MSKELTLTEVIHKSALVSLEDVKPLVSYLKYDDNLSSSADSCKKLADYLRKMGSNDIPYSEITTSHILCFLEIKVKTFKF